MATDASGNIYVAERYNSRIQKLTSDGTSLMFFDAPGAVGVALDSFGNVYAANNGSIGVR